MSGIKSPPIQLLPQSVIEKIAAGETIERPASVVKEFIENAIDAEATQIDTVIQEAGFASIKVSDNGFGMDRDNLERALQRHATSKISQSEDLYRLFTLGFRGEALASISAVSDVELASCPDKSGMGYCIYVEAGRAERIEPLSHGQGTTVTCKNLFYNVPARRKFMKSQRSEQLAIVTLVENIALAYPAIHFTCTIDKKRYLDFPSVDSFEHRITQVAGTEFSSKLIYCSAREQEMSVQIFITDPSKSKSRSSYQNLYVNLRRIDNDSVLYAVREAFSRFIASHIKPSWFCYLDINPSKIDVNVHPTKMKIKFDEEKKIFSFIFRAVHTDIARYINEAAGINELQTVKHYEAVSSLDDGTTRLAASSAGEPRYGKPAPKTTPQVYAPAKPQENRAQKGTVDAQQTVLPLISVFEAKEFKDFQGKEADRHEESNQELSGVSWNLIPCYQIHRMYILAPIKNGILLIDQHAAHERILFEEALENIEQGTVESQQLLFPILIEMSPVEKEVVIAARDYFNSIGFIVQDFGGKTLAVSSMPATGFLKSSDVEEAIREMVSSLIEEKDAELSAQPQKRFAASFACGAAIKFGKELTQEEMNILLNNLFGTKNPYTCPHGRPTLIRLSLDELSRRFLRS